MAARSAEEPPAGVRNVVCIYLNKEVVEKESRSCAVGKNARHNLIEQGKGLGSCDTTAVRALFLV